MKFLEKEEVYSWLRKYNYTVDNNGNPRSNLKLSSERIESDAGKRVCQAKNLLKNFEDKDESLLFYTDWSIWSSGEDMNLFNRLSLSHGEGRPLIERPGHVFSKEEFPDFSSFVVLGALFLWDIYVLDTIASHSMKCESVTL